MKKFISAALAFTMLATSSVALAGTSEARQRNHGYYNNDDNGHYYRRDRRHHNGNAAGAAILGFALGAIIVGSQQNRRSYDYDRYDSRDATWDHIRRCEARYRSYDRRTDTFIGRDGREYYCNL